VPVGEVESSAVGGTGPRSRVRGPGERTREGARRRLRRRVFRTSFLVALVAVVAVVAVAVGSGAWEIQPILSGSMRPGFPVGGVVVVQRVPTSSLRVRDVALFHPPGEPQVTYVHRIISLRHSPQGLIIRTQGDDNVFPDPWTLHVRGRWAYQARFTLPLVGYAAVWDHSRSGHKDLLLGVGGLLVVGAFVVIAGESRRRRRIVEGTDDVASGSVGSPMSGDGTVDQRARR